MAKSGDSGLLWTGVLAVGGYMLYNNFIKPNIVEPKRLMTYTARLRVYMPAARFKGDDVEFDIYIQNPNSYPLTVKAVVGDVFLFSQSKRYKLGNVARYGDVIIKPTAETKYTFKVRTHFLGLLPYFQDMIEGRIKHQTVSFQGYININGRPWPVKEGYRIS
jgi:hypothetical protein